MDRVHHIDRRVRLALFTVAYLTGPTALAFVVWLRAAGLIADHALWVYAALIGGSSAVDTVARHWYQKRPESAFFIHARFAASALTTAAVLYPAGWGSIGVLAYLLGAAQGMAQSRFYNWPLVLGWCVLAATLGEIGTELGWLPSMIAVELGHAVALFSMMCTGVVLWLFGATMRARHDAEQLLLQREERLEVLASTDPLTGVANRAAFAAHIAEARETHRSVVLAVADLDGFKDINDTHGHHVGDAVLCDVATALSSSVRSGDLVARLGGDEFVIVIDVTDSGVPACTVARRIEGALLDASGRSEHPFSASIGLAEGAAGEWTADELLRAADEAMYSVKRQSRGRAA